MSFLSLRTTPHYTLIALIRHRKLCHVLHTHNPSISKLTHRPRSITGCDVIKTLMAGYRKSRINIDRELFIFLFASNFTNLLFRSVGFIEKDDRLREKSLVTLSTAAMWKKMLNLFRHFWPGCQLCNFFKDVHAMKSVPARWNFSELFLLETIQPHLGWFFIFGAWNLLLFISVPTKAKKESLFMMLRLRIYETKLIPEQRVKLEIMISNSFIVLEVERSKSWWKIYESNNLNFMLETSLMCLWSASVWCSSILL